MVGATMSENAPLKPNVKGWMVSHKVTAISGEMN